MTAADGRPFRVAGIDGFSFEELDSTSSEARRRLAMGLKTPTVFVAKCQTLGRGRVGHEFFSPEGGLYFTLAYPTALLGDGVLRVTAKAAVAVVRGIEAFSGQKVGIKWVNDLVYEGRKVGGILSESVAGWVLIGIGLNARPVDLPAELRETAGSLGLPAGVNLADLLKMILTELLSELEKPEDTGYLDTYRARSVILGQEVTFGAYQTDGPMEMKTARAVAIDDEGGLVLELPDGSRITLNSGEIRVRPI